MASHITYDGISAAGTGGNIFNGKKFWVSRRVPQRDSLLEKIQNNSGHVVPLEKDADMLIADHARKDAPSGSYSWKFITESVNAGFIQVEDKYLIGPPPNQRKPILTGAHAKRTRTSFTEQDDAIVAKWILKNGIYTAGNKMYMDLEDEYPHHPWQSWRNRWVKVLSLRSNEEIDRLARLANVDVDNAPITARHIIRRHEREDWPGAAQAAQINAAASRTSGGNSQNNNRPSPKEPRKAQSQRREATVSDRNESNEIVSAAPELNDDSIEEGASIYHDAADGDQSVADEEAEPRRESEPKPEARPSEVTGAEPEGEQGEESRENVEQDSEGDDIQDDGSVDEGLSSFSEREQFLSDLQDYCEANGRELDVRCVIGKNEVDLWELYYAVSMQALPPDKLDWKQVAEHVGLEWTKNDEVMTSLLKSSYDRHLADFVEAMMSFEENEEDPDEDMEDEETAARDEESAAESSTTPRTSQRNSAASPLLGNSDSTNSRKRLPDGLLTPKRAKRRQTVHTEIPMTPEDQQRTGRRPSAPASAPANLQSMVVDQEEQAEVETPRQRTPRNRPRQPSPDEPDMTPSQQLRSETDSVASPETNELGTPTLHYSPASSYPQRNNRRLETIQEEDSTTSTPTRIRSKKRELPASFQQPRESRAAQLEERRERKRQHKERRERHLQRQQQLLEEQQRQEQLQEERRLEEQQQRELQQTEQGQEQELQRQRWHQDAAADSSETDPEVVQQSQEQFVSWKEHYLKQDFSEEFIIEAMRRTTMTPGEAMEAVMTSLRDGRGIPSNHEGIWTDRDDAQLKYVVRVGQLELVPGEGGDTRRRKEKAQKMLDRLLFKHGEFRVKLRRKFHRAMADVERDRRLRDEPIEREDR